MDSLLEPSPASSFSALPSRLTDGNCPSHALASPPLPAGLACPLFLSVGSCLGMVVSSSADAQALLWPQWGARVVLTGLLVFPDQLTLRWRNCETPGVKTL